MSSSYKKKYKKTKRSRKSILSHKKRKYKREMLYGGNLITEYNKEQNFIYPIELQLPTKNPHELDILYSLKKILPWNWNKKYDKDFPLWVYPRNQVLYHIKNNILDQNGFLAEGTKLYHGSIESDLKFTKDRITFFGLDVIISLWYILELIEIKKGLKKNSPNIGYLYEFELIKPMRPTILEPIVINPKGAIVCQNDNICIHPQITFHGYTMDPPFDLCIELTFNLKYYKDFIKLNKIYKVDASILHQNRNKTFKEFNPVNAIL